MHQHSLGLSCTISETLPATQCEATVFTIYAQDQLILVLSVLCSFCWLASTLQ